MDVLGSVGLIPDWLHRSVVCVFVFLSVPVKLLTGSKCATCAGGTVDSKWSIRSHSGGLRFPCEEQGKVEQWKRRVEQDLRLSEYNEDKAREYHYN